MNLKKVSNQDIVRLWKNELKGKDSEFDISQGLSILFSEGKMTAHRIEKIFEQIPQEGNLDFIDYVEETASHQLLTAVTDSGQFSLFEINLFAIAFSGDVEAIEQSLANPEIFLGLSKSLRETGWAADRSSVVLFPQVLPIHAITKLSPQNIWNLMSLGKELLSDKNDHDVLREMYSKSDLILDPLKASFIEGRSGVLLGNRMVFGVRLREVDVSGEKEDVADCLSGYGAPFSDDEEADFLGEVEVYSSYMLEMQERWFKHIDSLFSRERFVAMPPAPWMNFHENVSDQIYTQVLGVAGVEEDDVVSLWFKPEEFGFLARAKTKKGEVIPFELPRASYYRHGIDWFEKLDVDIHLVDREEQLPVLKYNV